MKLAHDGCAVLVSWRTYDISPDLRSLRFDEVLLIVTEDKYYPYASKGGRV